MLSFFKIWTVAYYEIKTLMRSWFFRIFSLLTFTILVLLNVSLFSTRFSPWILRGIPSSIPYLNLMFLNIVQAIIGIFMASDFLKYDKKLDSTEVIYMRSMTNADYVLGKSLGVFVLFFILNVLILIVALVFNVFFADVVGVFNSVAGTSYKSTSENTVKLLQARCNEGFKDVNDYKLVFEYMKSKWANDAKMCQYFRPRTLLNGNFEGYLEEARIRKKETDNLKGVLDVR